jgi:hypothetical protein
LQAGGEHFEATDDFVVVQRVLSREEVQAYATSTQRIREEFHKEKELKKAREELAAYKHERELKEEVRKRWEKDIAQRKGLEEKRKRWGGGVSHRDSKWI